MAKHLALGSAVKRLTETTELVSMLNHFGHCIWHASILELETAVCHNNMQSTSLLPVSVFADNYIVTHFCWDNFDLQEETVSGSGTTHSTHDTIIHEVSATSAGVVLQQTAGNQSQPRSRRSVEAAGASIMLCKAEDGTCTDRNRHDHVCTCNTVGGLIVRFFLCVDSSKACVCF